jgi:hypothetical protein
MVKISSPAGAFKSTGTLAQSNPSMEQIAPAAAPASTLGQPLAPLPDFLQSSAQAEQLSSGALKAKG